MPTLAPKFLEPNAGLSLIVPGGDRSTSKLMSHETTERFSLSEYTVLPQQGPPLHLHEREDETFYILEGEVHFSVDGKRIVAKAGSTVFGPRGTPHTFKNCSDKPAKFLLLVTPGSNFESFFGRVAAHDAQGKAPTDEVMIGRIISESPIHGIKILGPSPL